MDRPAGRWLPVLAVVVGLGVVAVASGSGLTGLPTQPPTDPGQGAPPPPAGEATGGSTPLALDVLLGVLVGLLAAGVLAVVGRLVYLGLRALLVERVWRRPVDAHGASQPGGSDEVAEVLVAEVREAARAGLADIDSGGNARHAVIACWLRLERVAAAVGTPRSVGDAPGDLVARLSARHRVDGRALDRLAGAYRRARYAPAEVGGSSVELARQALQEVDRQLSVVRPVAARSAR